MASRLEAWFGHKGAAGLISDGGPLGRYSYLMAGPDAEAVLGYDDPGDAAAFLRDAMTFIRPQDTQPGLPPFSGGLIGMASFELGLRLEGLPRKPFHLGGEAWPELIVRRYPAVLAFDHRTEILTAIGRGATYAEAEAARDRLIALYEATPANGPVSGALADGPLALETPDNVHEALVAQLVEQIHAGTLYQANLARGWAGRLKAGVTPGQVMAALNQRGAAPYGAFVNFADRAIVSNSPERFIALAPDGRLETRPIKGTRPRGQTPEEDARLAAELLSSEKDRAENLMIVDLMRHDLAKVSDPGSVRVEALNALETYPNVHHLVSTVTARLRKGLTAADVLAATLPAGSISGAPKVQAMKAIHTMEAARGPYCGALFFVDVAGAMDSSVLIRTLALEHTDGLWRFRAAAGGGIVADSEPRAERIETETKLSLIKAVLEG